MRNFHEHSCGYVGEAPRGIEDIAGATLRAGGPPMPAKVGTLPYTSYPDAPQPLETKVAGFG